MSSINEILLRSGTHPGISSSLPLEISSQRDDSSSLLVGLFASISVVETPFLLLMMYIFFVFRRLLVPYLRRRIANAFTSRVDLRLELSIRMCVASEVSEYSYSFGRSYDSSELPTVGVEEDGLTEIRVEP